MEEKNFFEIKEDTLYNRKGYNITKDNLRLFITNEIGGRILWYGTLTKNILHPGEETLYDIKFNYSHLNFYEQVRNYRIKQGWLDLGGYKTWLAPQDRWQGPPYIDLDSGTYQMKYYIKNNNDLFIKQTSPICKETGILLEREITISNKDFSVEFNVKITSTKEETKSWGIWHVAQVIKPCVSFIKNAKILKYEKFGEDSDINDFIEYDEDHKALKIITPSEEKRGYKVYLLAKTDKIVSYFNRELILITSFKDDSDKVFAHDSNIEIYSDFRKNYAEIEVHSPFVQLNKNNRELSHSFKWELKVL